MKKSVIGRMFSVNDMVGYRNEHNCFDICLKTNQEACWMEQ